jgi:hypothetical protein
MFTFLIANLLVYFSLLASLIIIYIIGNLIYSLFETNYKKYTSIFFIFLIGIFSSTILTSLILSKGKTYNLSILICIPLLIYLSQPIIKFQLFFSNFKRNFSFDLLFLFIPALIYFWIQSFNYYNPFTNESFCLEGDQLYYATIGNYLYQFGIENRFLDTLNITQKSLIPYHYGDSWFIAFFLHFVPYNAPIVLNFICNPTLMIVFYIGRLSILERYKNNPTIKDKLIFLFIPFFTTLSLPIFDFLPGQIYSWSIINLPKLSINYLGIQLFFILIINKKINNALYFIIPFFVLYLVSLPIIFSSCILILFYFLFFKEITKIEFIKILIFYTIFIIKIITSNPYIYGKTFLNCIIGSILLTISGFLIYGLIALFKPKIILHILKHKLTILFLIFYSVGLGFYGLFNYNPDGAQLWYNTFYPIVGTFCCLFLAFILINKFKSRNYLIIIGLIGLNLYLNNPLKAKCPTVVNQKPRISLNNQEAFYKKLNEKINKRKDPKIAFLKDFNHANVFGKNPFTPIFPNNATYTKNYFPICLSVYNIPNSKDSIIKIMENNSISNTIFYKFTELEKRNGTYSTIEDNQLKFIKEHKIDFIEVDKNTELPIKIDKLIKQKIVNPITGDKFYILNAM